MKLTTKSEYSILALLYIARYGNSSYVKIEDICDQYDIPKKYLEQLFIQLKQSQLLKSKRGANGGYKLALPADEITLAQVVRTMDGALAPSESVSEFYHSSTPVGHEEKIVHVLRDIRNYIAEKLENTSLADVQ